MKTFVLLLCAIALQAEDAQPLATVEQLQAKVAEQQKQIAELTVQVQMGQIYRQRAYACLESGTDEQIKAQAQAQIDAQAKKEKK